MTTKAKFLNGLNTIGGNIVSFANNKTRIFMDFGVPEDSKAGDSITSLIEKGILPDTPELFTENARQTYDQQAIFISHLHIDHIGALKFLKPQLPIYMSAQSKKLYDDLIQAGDELPIADLQAVDYGQMVKIGPFTVTFFQSDHDVIGASAIEVVDDQGHHFVHSGDLRYNGPYPQRLDHWTQAVAQTQPDLFLIEGTSFSFDDDKGDHAQAASTNVEADLLQHFIDKLPSNHLLAINPYPRNVERLYALEMAANDFGRPIVWESFYAGLLKQFFPKTRPLVLGKDIDLSQIIAYPENYVLQNSYDHLDYLKDFYKPIFLQMNGEPLGDYDPRYQLQQAKLTQFAAEFIYAGASGHATQADLLKAAKRVHAKLTIPWHSFKPEIEAAALRGEGLTAKIASKNEVISF
ncbi:hydrolase [Oenococcus sicerae]|uniref:Hydrolase n=1 Tax=Oenococcus sicerae TaxID=2203724 RepID=A0AAJ1RBV0_9LACO|nr:MBL fold metallo-hydrolase [Oenococcus sicerae]MDN6900030.1 hydrolase [Oenococcus sicerae]QAS69640.1 hydrolase [Oenococcus sicerae]